MHAGLAGGGHEKDNERLLEKSGGSRPCLSCKLDVLYDRKKPTHTPDLHQKLQRNVGQHFKYKS